MRKANKPSPAYDVIFVKSFRHHKTGKIVRRADGGAIPIRVRRKK